MSYIENSLTNEEEILFRAKIHWAFFSTPVVYFLIGLFFMVDGVGTIIRTFGLTGLNKSLGFTQLLESVATATGLQAHTIIGYSFFLIAAIYLYTHIVKYLSTEIGLTNNRVIVKVGWLRIDTVELMLNKIETIMVHQGIYGRLLNYGAVSFIGAGNSGGNFTWIANPLEFKELVQKELGNIEEDAPQATDAEAPTFEV